MFLGWITAWGAASRAGDPGGVLDEHAVLFLATALTTTLILLLIVGRRGRHRLYGFQWPEGYRWTLVVPVVVVGAIAGGIWLLWSISFDGIVPGPRSFASWVILLGFPLLAEVLFRGLAHGLMIENFSVQHSDGRWFVSWPVAISALLYAIWTLPFLRLTLVGILWPLAAYIAVPLGAMLCGVGLGVARERSGGVLVPLAIHYLAVLAVMIAGLWLR